VASRGARRPNGDRWNEREAAYGEIGRWLAEKAAAGQGVVVMAGDAPGLTWHTGHLAIAVPNEPLDTVLAVADRYGARYLVWMTLGRGPPMRSMTG